MKAFYYFSLEILHRIYLVPETINYTNRVPIIDKTGASSHCIYDMYISFKDIYLGEILKSNTTGDTSGAETAYPS